MKIELTDTVITKPKPTVNEGESVTYTHPTITKPAVKRANRASERGDKALARSEARGAGFPKLSKKRPRGCHHWLHGQRKKEVRDQQHLKGHEWGMEGNFDEGGREQEQKKKREELCVLLQSDVHKGDRPMDDA